MQLAQLAATIGQLDGDAGIPDDLDIELGKLAAPAQLDDLPDGCAEDFEIALTRRPIQRALFGFELSRFDERIGAWRTLRRLRKTRVGLEAIRHGEPHVGALVRMALAAPQFMGETAAAHVDPAAKQ